MIKMRSPGVGLEPQRSISQSETLDHAIDYGQFGAVEQQLSSVSGGPHRVGLDLVAVLATIELFFSFPSEPCSLCSIDELSWYLIENYSSC